MRPPIANVLLAALVVAGCGGTVLGEDLDLEGGADAEPSDAVEREAAAADRSSFDDRAIEETAALDAEVDVGLLDARADVARDAPRDVGRDLGVDARRDGGTDAGPRDVAAGEVFDGGVGRCPPAMVLVAGRVCVDRWEASLEQVEMDGGTSAWSPYSNPGTRRVVAVSRPDVQPQGYISGSESEAACRAAGKRLCALDEWVAACRGPANLVYPYGNAYERRRCNEARTPHPVVQFYGTSTGVFTFERMNNPGINMQANTVANTGSFTGCESPWGLFDMVGNLHEWIADSAGTFKGGFYVDAEINGRGCLYTTTAHGFTYRDYSTGFRCCANPR